MYCTTFSVTPNNMQYCILINLNILGLQRPPRRRRPRYNKQTEDVEESKPVNGEEEHVEENQDTEPTEPDGEKAESNGQQE